MNNEKREYLVQGLNNNIVVDCITTYSIEGARLKSTGGWSTWFESIAVYDISNPSAPIKIYL